MTPPKPYTMAVARAATSESAAMKIVRLNAIWTPMSRTRPALSAYSCSSPAREEQEYADRAGRVRDIGVQIAFNRTIFIAALSLVAALATAMVYGFGGVMAVNGTLSVGTLLALAALLARLYGPLTSLSNVRVDVMTALISFERVFYFFFNDPATTES